jgi:hypothetical protein
MYRLKMKVGLMVLILGGMLCLFSLTQAAAITQGEYVVLLAAKLGLGAGLTAAQATTALEGVGIVPEDGWQLKRDVTCALVDEVQILTIKAAQKGLIKYDPQDIPPLMASLSDECGACAPTVLAAPPSGGAAPPPAIATDVPRGGGGAASPSH